MPRGSDKGFPQLPQEREHQPTRSGSGSASFAPHRCLPRREMYRAWGELALPAVCPPSRWLNHGPACGSPRWSSSPPPAVRHRLLRRFGSVEPHMGTWSKSPYMRWAQWRLVPCSAPPSIRIHDLDVILSDYRADSELKPGHDCRLLAHPSRPAAQSSSSLPRLSTWRNSPRRSVHNHASPWHPFAGARLGDPAPSRRRLARAGGKPYWSSASFILVSRTADRAGRDGADVGAIGKEMRRARRLKSSTGWNRSARGGQRRSRVQRRAAGRARLADCCSFWRIRRSRPSRPQTVDVRCPRRGQRNSTLDADGTRYGSQGPSVFRNGAGARHYRHGHRL